MSIRTTDDLKRKSQIVKGSSRYTDEDFWRIGMEKLASRMDCLEFRETLFPMNALNGVEERRNQYECGLS
ncbi:hypothetical protein [Methanobrevibacter sp.]|uniref:hypothetical protein n=1 Tax=Methanobrevibacter sp. TaxID=66852 RepID=UPI0026E07904|nr:hypothetical protein [Methanobrevibacter sp.]